MVSCLALLQRTHALREQVGEFSHTACGLVISVRHADRDLFAADPDSASCEQCQQQRNGRPDRPGGLAMSPNPVTPDPVIVRSRILELLDEFHGRIDRGVSIADLLVSEAKFKTPVRNAEGREAFAALMLALFEKRRQNGRTARHIGTNVNIEDIGSGRFRVRSFIIVLAADSGADAQGFLNTGDHVDIVEMDPGGTCRFVERTMTPVLQFALTPSVGGP
jgi:hypothetical protein